MSQEGQQLVLGRYFEINLYNGLQAGTPSSPDFTGGCWSFPELGMGETEAPARERSRRRRGQSIPRDWIRETTRESLAGEEGAPRL